MNFFRIRFVCPKQNTKTRASLRTRTYRGPESLSWMLWSLWTLVFLWLQVCAFLYLSSTIVYYSTNHLFLFKFNAPSAGICIRYHIDCHSLQMVLRNSVVAPRDVVNKNFIVAAIDVFVTGIFVPPFNSYPLPNVLNIKGVSYVRVEYWVAMFSFLKLNWSFRFLLQTILNKFADSLMLRKLAHFEPGMLFAIKVSLLKYPIKFLTCCWFALFSCLAYTLRIIEAPANENILPLSQTLWLCITSFTTIGYGDIVPKSHFGRFLTAVGIAAAYILIALTIVTWQKYITMKYSEKNVLKVYQYSLMKAQLRNGASSLLTKWLRITIQKSKIPGRKWTVTLYWAMLEEVGGHDSRRLCETLTQRRSEHGGSCVRP